MELTITFQNKNNKTIIPIDYQYYLSSWMYDVLSKGNEEYANFLHNKGYSIKERSNKVFKLFCFSHLIIKPYKFNSSSLEILAPTFYMKVRFSIDAAIEHFVKGLFIGQQLKIKSGFNEMAIFDVIGVEINNMYAIGERTRIRALSPIVVSKKEGNNEKYLSPNDEGYEGLFFYNLIDKYRAKHQQLPVEWQDHSLSLDLVNRDKVRSHLIKIRKQNEADIQVRGFTYDFYVTAPRELVELGLMAGFGKDNAMGFGFGDVIG